jgi:hypothetical protein
MIGFPSWAIEFSFNVFHEGTLSGDGFAFWVSPQKEIAGRELRSLPLGLPL